MKKFIVASLLSLSSIFVLTFISFGFATQTSLIPDAVLENSPLFEHSLKMAIEELDNPGNVIPKIQENQIDKTQRQYQSPSNIIIAQPTLDYTSCVTCSTCLSTVCVGQTCGGATCYTTCENCITTYGATCGTTCVGPTCGTTCGTTCGATCGTTCVGATCGTTCSGATCDTTCSGATCDTTCGATCGTTCGATCGTTCSGATCNGWVTIHGTVTYNGTPLCAMVLANGQYMFSCEENQGTYELEIPLDENGEITLFAFVDGLAPFKQILAPWEALDFDIEMELASPGSKTPTVTSTVVESIDYPGWIDIAGSVSLEGTPLCAMVLVNGQYRFSCDPDGEYQLTVPLDPNGEITLFVFVDGLQPYKEINSFNEDTDATLRIINNFYIAQDISLDNRFIGTVQPNTTRYFQISAGHHTLKACDQKTGCIYHSFDIEKGETVTYTIASS